LYRETMARRCASSSFFMNKIHTLSEKRKVLAARILAQKIGYLKVEDFPTNFFENLPSQAFSAHKIVRAKDQLFVIKEGIVEIWNPHQDMLVTELQAGALFGEISLLGQSMFECQAIAGSGGVTVGVMELEVIAEWIKTEPMEILEELGPRLVLVEAEHYRAIFQTIEHRLSALLLELAGESSVVEGYTQDDFAQQL
jgi:CRP-like cAMP-binding protein